MSSGIYKRHDLRFSYASDRKMMSTNSRFGRQPKSSIFCYENRLMTGSYSFMHPRSLTNHVLNTRIFIIPLLGWLVWTPLEAKHIIGGDIQYECLGGGMYHFRMKIYRDCRPQEMAAALDGAGGDAGAYISVFRGGSSFVQLQRLTAPLKSRAFIDHPDYPCLIPPSNLCVEEGLYEFTLQLPDWPSSESYHIVYQRCCRNNTISNIIAPGTSGATYSIEITPEAQRLCNNSPRFRSFPPTVVCVGADINFDHSAIDAEGDSLVYRFCHPLKGGGPDTQLFFSSCDGARPNPPCPPPFQLVAFQRPYAVDEPLLGDPVVRLDPRTGLITGKPQAIGQFVVGVCVEEYRDGILLSEIKRDFQFNVADCDPTVVAQVKSDAMLGQKEFVINSCGNNTILFENESILEAFIDTYRWEFDINGSVTTVDTRDAEVTFPGVGTYRGVMMVNPGTICGDTAEIFVNLYPSVRADFSFDYDTCVAGPTSFQDLSATGANRIESWTWSFGEGGTSEQANPMYTYAVPGDHQVSLTVKDDNECVDTETKLLPYYPVPALIVVDPSSFVGCSPATVRFDNLSVPIDSTYDIVWDFGDGQQGFEVSPVHVFEQPGTFTIDLDITSPIGCHTEAQFRDWIQVKESPRADFSYSPDQPSNFNPHVQFSNQSENHISQQWIFDQVGRSGENNPSFTFPDTGMYQVYLIAVHENGCRDTSAQLIDVIPLVTYHMPNAFTPNDDGKNDTFGGKGFTEGIQGFELSIWSRWGELLFVTDDPNERWNGAKNNQGPVLANGVYVYQVKYVDARGERVELKGFATLIL